MNLGQGRQIYLKTSEKALLHKTGLMVRLKMKICHCLLFKDSNNSIGIFCLQTNFKDNIVMKWIRTRIKHRICGKLGGWVVTDEVQLAFSGVSLKEEYYQSNYKFL